ncbi:MAG TPA: hypothetical protein VFT70_14290 [Nocardioides sp.]|nr:hypothetical protein [Nocardioides sp.]
MQDWIVPVAAGVLALVALGLGLALLRARSRTDRELATSRAETAALRAQLDELERRVAAPERRRASDAEYVITNLGDPDPGSDAASAGREPTPHVGGALFADLVLRETVVKAASLAHGVRRALDPETRNRIRFEMRREVKRARKQRRADTREARREWEARQRSAVDQDPAKDPAA